MPGPPHLLGRGLLCQRLCWAPLSPHPARPERCLVRVSQRRLIHLENASLQDCSKATSRGSWTSGTESWDRAGWGYQGQRDDGAGEEGGSLVLGSRCSKHPPRWNPRSDLEGKSESSLCFHLWDQPGVGPSLQCRTVPWSYMLCSICPKLSLIHNTLPFP